MSTFKASEEKTQPSGANFLTVPYCGPVQPLEFKKEKVGSVDDCFVAEVKLLDEDFEGNDVSGLTAEYVEWNPEGKPNEQQENAVNRLNYFVQHFVPKEEALSVEANSWEEYVEKMIRLLRKHNATDRDDIHMKWKGDVYQGQPKIKNPGYHNFVSNKNSEEELSWSQSELQDNKKYMKVLNSEPTDPDDADSVDDLEDQTF